MIVLPNPFQDCVDQPGPTQSAAAVEAAPTIAAAEPISNSAGQVMLAADTAAVIDPVTVAAVVPIGISVIRHNPITQAVEIRPITCEDSNLVGRYMSHGLSPALGTSNISADADTECSASADLTDCIGEIFHHARKLLAEDNRRAEDFVDWPAFEAALEEPLPLFIRDGGHLRRSAA